MTTDLFLLLLLGSAFWIWLAGVKARELGLAYARSACRKENLQLLDETVVLSAFRFVRNAHGTPCLQRSYTFEFSMTGDERITGHIVLCGHELQMLDLGPANHTPPTRIIDLN